jgi:hypothetical protein
MAQRFFAISFFALGALAGATAYGSVDALSLSRGPHPGPHPGAVDTQLPIAVRCDTIPCSHTVPAEVNQSIPNPVIDLSPGPQPSRNGLVGMPNITNGGDNGYSGGSIMGDQITFMRKGKRIDRYMVITLYEKPSKGEKTSDLMQSLWIPDSKYTLMTCDYNYASYCPTPLPGSSRRGK